MTGKPSALIPALAIVMVAGGMILLHLFRNLSAASGSGTTPTTPTTPTPTAGSSGPLFDAIAKDDLAAVTATLSSKPDLEQPAATGAHKGLTPLRAAAASAKPELVKALLTAGAKPDTASPDGRTPLMDAAAMHRADNIAALAEAGATIDARDTKGRTALMVAAAADHLDATRALLGVGASVNTADESGVTALSIAAAGPGDIGILHLLLDAGATTDSTTPDGITPLMLAAKTGTAEKVILLLNAGASPAAKSKEGKTARDYAKTRTDEQGKMIAQCLPD